MTAEEGNKHLDEGGGRFCFFIANAANPKVRKKVKTSYFQFLKIFLYKKADIFVFLPAMSQRFLFFNFKILSCYQRFQI